MPLRVDILYTTAKGQERRPLFELREGVVRSLDPFAEELARDGITTDGRTILYPKDGLAFMEALHIALSGGSARATKAYETANAKGPHA